MSETVTFEKEMAINYRDFLRILERALDGQELKVEGRTITLVEKGRTLAITLSEERERRIALIALPVTDVTFSYTGYDEPEKHLAMLDRSFQRGGG
jgi:hypothetical protein